ncbi:MAG: hypothetical protein A4E69_01868 [Syntrophus sp. PtaB.Bin138]|nr:MAG: hypothetical protein A4E69_01868 [Syntrophus sp. PtaB.Bin138]
MLDNRTIKFPFSEDSMQTLVAYDASNRPQYIGLAHPGVATSAAQWQIRKITYDAVTGNPTSVQFAGGANDYSSVWDDRAALSYS